MELSFRIFGCHGIGVDQNFGRNSPPAIGTMTSIGLSKIGLNNFVGQVYADKIRIWALFIIISCASSNTKDSQPKEVRIDVERINPKTWRVTYVLPRKVLGVYFHRQTNQFRKSEWTVKGEDLVIGRLEGHEILYSKSKTPFQKMVVEFTPYFKHTPKDYEFFQPYTDGGILFYTGHLYVHPLSEGSRTEVAPLKLKHIDGDEWVSALNIRPFDGGNVVVQGVVDNRKVNWKDHQNKGTYVYFGRLNPIETESVIAVIDSGIPKWIQKTMNSFLPKLFDLYAKKTGQKLTFKPIVYFNYKPTDMSGTSNSGGTLPGIVQLTIEGKEWEKESQSTLEHIIWFLAHESAHFWNGQMFDNIDDQAAWLHEGGADAFAYRSLYELGIIDKGALAKDYNNALNLCIMGLNGKSLNSSSERRKFKNYYDCGSTIMLMVELALQQEKDQDLFNFWEELLEQSKAHGQKYGSKDFHRVLVNKFMHPELSKLIGDIEVKDSMDQMQLFNKMAKIMGVKFIENNENASGEFLFELNRKFLSDVMRTDCNGRVDISGRGKGFLIFGKGSCKTFKSKRYDVVRFDGIEINRKSGYKPILAAKKSCAANGKVELGVSGSREVLTLKCPKEVKVFPWLELVN